MAVALRINPRFPLPRNPSAALSSAAAAAETNPPHLAAGSPETTETPPSPPPDPAGSPSPRKALDKLKSAIRSESDPDRLAALFESAAQHKHFHSDPRFYPLTVQKLARARRPDLIKRLLNNSTSDPAIPQSDGFIARIINLYSTASMPGQAVSTFHRAVSAGHPLAERSLCALLSAFLKAGELDRAVEAFDNIPKQLNLTPGLVAHNILLQILCKKGDVAAARKLLDEMSNTDCAKPDIISYTTVLDGYLSKDDEAGFDEILDEIDGAGLVASVVTYNCRITFFCRKKEMVKAEEVLDEMAAKRVTPNRASFKNLIEGFYKVDDMGSALRVFKRMKMLKRKENMNNLAPDADTYNMLIGGLVRKGEFGSALEVCKECLARKLIPPFELVKRLAEGLKGTSKDDEAKDIVERMRAVVKASGAIDAWKKVEKELCLSPAVIKQEGSRKTNERIKRGTKWRLRQHAYTGHSMESTAFHPASLGNNGFSDSSPVHTQLPHTGGNNIDHSTSSAHVVSPQHQRHHGFHGRTMSSWNRRSNSSTNQFDNKKQYELDIDRILDARVPLRWSPSPPLGRLRSCAHVCYPLCSRPHLSRRRPAYDRACTHMRLCMPPPPICL